MKNRKKITPIMTKQIINNRSNENDTVITINNYMIQYVQICIFIFICHCN